MKKTLMMVAMAMWVLGADSAPTLQSPVNESTVALQNARQKAYFAKDRANRWTYMNSDDGRKAMIAATSRPEPVEFSWSGGTAPYTLTVKRVSDGATFALLNNISTTSVKLYNFEIGRKYSWTVMEKGGAVSVTRTFTTETDAPRFLRVGLANKDTFYTSLTKSSGEVSARANGSDFLPNFRDVGGVFTADRRQRMKQGLIFRSYEFDAHGSEWKSYGVDTDLVCGTGPGQFGIKTDLDLRSDSEVAAIVNTNNGKSPLNTTAHPVAWQHCAIAEYDAARLGTDERNALALISDASKYPLVIHGICGQDSTGCLAIYIYAILGVDDETMLKSWEASSFFQGDNNFSESSPGFRSYRIQNFIESFRAYGTESDTLADCVVKALREKGVVNDKMITQIRENLLETDDFCDSVEYIDADGVKRWKHEGEFDVVTSETRMLTNGWWAVKETVTISERSLVVQGDVHLILCDGAELKVENPGLSCAAIQTTGATLTIYGQTSGSGKLTATGGRYSAGIGGGQSCAGGNVTINGGTVTAQGGECGAGIGGGREGAGGTVTISGGAVIARAGEDAADIGPGWFGVNNGKIEITGGIFGMDLSAGWIPDGYAAFENPDDQTRETYPWKVLPSVTVTLEGGLQPGLVATWTSDGSTVENPISGETFKVPKGTTGVKVIFTPEHNYRFKDNGETGIRTLPSPIDDDSSVTPPEVEGIPGTVARPWNVGEGVTAYVSDEKTLVVGGTGAMTDFASAAAVPWHEDAGAITAVTIAEGVTKVGKNALAALADTVTVNGTPLLTYRSITTINGMTLEEFNAKNRFLNLGSEMQIVAKAEIAAAEAEAVKVAENKVKLRVSVAKSNNPEAVSWSKATIEGATVETDGEVTLTVPADFANGYMILKTKDAESTGDGVKSAQTVGMLSVQNSAKQAAVGVPFGRLEGWKVEI